MTQSCGGAHAAGTVCDACDGEQQRRERGYAERQAAQNRDDWLCAIGVPLKYHHASFATLAATPAVDAARKFYELEKWRRGPDARALVLTGPTGTGKTSAACALVMELLPYLRRHQRFALASVLGRRLLDYHQADEAMREATTSSLLVLDDLNLGGNARALAMIEEVIIAREAEGRALVVTSNLTPQQLRAVFSDRVVDRLRAWGDTVACTGPSFRTHSGATR